MGKAIAPGRDAERIQRIGPGMRGRGHGPVVDPCRKGFGCHARLTDAAPRQPFGAEMTLGRCQPGMRHPKLRAIPALGVVGCKRRAKQRPLGAIIRAIGARQACGQIPPFDAVAGVWAVIGGKIEYGG